MLQPLENSENSEGDLTHYSDVFSLRAFLAGSYFKCNILAFQQGAAAFHVDCGEVYEDILSTFTRDEAKAFFFVEPFYDTGF